MNRQSQILQAIVKHFIETAEPVGSQTILVSYRFEVSPATIRNDMAHLEEEGMLFQPHTSAGRVPTEQGYRRYVDSMMDITEGEHEAQQALAELSQVHARKKMRNVIHDAVSLLAETSGNVSFATLPDNPRTFFLGVSNVLRQPEFLQDPYMASKVIEAMEKTDNFRRTLNELNISDEPRIFIGKENLLSEFQSCSLVVCQYNYEGYKGFMGLLGPTRMRYPFNLALLKKVKEMVFA